MNSCKLILKIIILVLLFFECSSTNNFSEIQQSKIEMIEKKLGELKEGDKFKIALLNGQKIKGKYISFEKRILFLHEINDSRTEEEISKIPFNQIATISILSKKISHFQLFIGATLFAIIVSYFLLGQAVGQRL